MAVIVLKPPLNLKRKQKLKKLIQQLSTEAIKCNPDFFSEEEKAEQWIGRNPASNEAIVDAEKKLDIKLPDDVIELYKVSNGTSVILNQTLSGFMPIEQIDWLKNADSYLIECYVGISEELTKDLENSIIIAGINYCHNVFLIQPYGEHKEWRYWEFASYYPGQVPFDGIQKYLKKLVDFLIAENNQFTVKNFKFLQGEILHQEAYTYTFNIPISAFKLDEENVETALRLDFIKLSKPIENYIDETITFPVNPNEGYIDGSIYLRGAHNPVDITAIKVIKLKDSILRVELNMNFIFEFEGIGLKNENLITEITLSIN